MNGFGQRIRTAYAYDSAGRLEYETQTREAGGSTNLYKTQYAYSYIAAGSGGGRQLVRTEQSYSGGAWVNDNKLTYKYDALERLGYEERHDWASGAWSTRYDTTQSYDKNGNRTGYDHNVAGGYTTSYGRACNLSYTLDAVNALTAVTDADDARYGAALTCDPNGNITTVMEYNYSAGTPPIPESTLQTDFTYDDLNRLTRHQTTRYVGGGTANTQYVRREHEYDATGRLVKSSYLTWYEGDTPPSPSSLEHVYAGANHVQNYDGTNYGSVWHWAGSSGSASVPLASAGPLTSPNPDTASQKGYNIAAMGGKNTPQRRTWLDVLTEGDKRELYGQGRPQAKDSSGNGANWYLGTTSDPPVSGTAVESRFFFEGTVTATDMSRATDAREAQRIGVFGTSNSYAGSAGRVTNEAIGRDLNPLGRGSGYALVGGMVNLGSIAPTLPAAILGGGMQGNSVNNPCFGCGGGSFPGMDILREDIGTADPQPAAPPEMNPPSEPRGRRFFSPEGLYQRCDCGPHGCGGDCGSRAVNKCCGWYNYKSDACDCRRCIQPGVHDHPDDPYHNPEWCFYHVGSIIGGGITDCDLYCGGSKEYWVGKSCYEACDRGCARCKGIAREACYVKCAFLCLIADAGLSPTVFEGAAHLYYACAVSCQVCTGGRRAYAEKYYLPIRDSVREARRRPSAFDMEANYGYPALEAGARAGLLLAAAAALALAAAAAFAAGTGLFVGGSLVPLAPAAPFSGGAIIGGVAAV